MNHEEDTMHENSFSHATKLQSNLHILRRIFGTHFPQTTPTKSTYEELFVLGLNKHIKKS